MEERPLGFLNRGARVGLGAAVVGVDVGARVGTNVGGGAGVGVGSAVVGADVGAHVGADVGGGAGVGVGAAVVGADVGACVGPSVDVTEKTASGAISTPLLDPTASKQGHHLSYSLDPSEVVTVVRSPSQPL